jgi:hypothetical protein
VAENEFHELFKRYIGADRPPGRKPTEREVKEAENALKVEDHEKTFVRTNKERRLNEAKNLLIRKLASAGKDNSFKREPSRYPPEYFVFQLNLEEEEVEEFITQFPFFQQVTTSKGLFYSYDEQKFKKWRGENNIGISSLPQEEITGEEEQVE